MRERAQTHLHARTQLTKIQTKVLDDDSSGGRSSRDWGLLMEWLWHYAFGMEAAALHDPAVRAAVDRSDLRVTDRIFVDRAPCLSAGLHRRLSA